MASKAYSQCLVNFATFTILAGSAEDYWTTCPDAWMAFDGSCYLFATDSTMTFYEAEHFCRQHDGHLVHVDNAKENAFLKQHIRSGKGENYWIGLTDEKVNGFWEWYDTHNQPTFTDWYPGEPNDNDHLENCVHFYPKEDYKWNDVPCDHRYEPLCEISGRISEIVG